MTDPKVSSISDCCEADVYRDKKDRAGVDDNGIEYWYWGNFCSQCHLPCQPKIDNQALSSTIGLTKKKSVEDVRPVTLTKTGQPKEREDE